MTAEYKVHGDVAVITMNNPPINGLGYSTRVGITDGLALANADAAVKSIIITGAGKAFSGGADIKEFGSPKALQEPNLLTLIQAFEESRHTPAGSRRLGMQRTRHTPEQDRHEAAGTGRRRTVHNAPRPSL